MNQTTDVHSVPAPVLPPEVQNATSAGSVSAPASVDIQLPADAPAAADPARRIHEKLLEGKVIEAVREIYDPEIPVNIYELGLIYEIKVLPGDAVELKMTLTSPGCPVAGSLPGQVEARISSIPEVTSAKIELVWDPPWSKDRMSEAAMLQLGFM